MSIFLYEWFRFKWSFNTGGKQYKQATGTQLKGDTTACNVKVGKNFGTLSVCSNKSALNYTLNWFQKINKNILKTTQYPS